MSIPDILLNLVNSSGNGKFFPRTEIFKEGWMIKIVMAINSQSSCFPFPTMEGSSWFSEAQLLTPFYERFRSDSLYEKRTHSDGVIGHIGIDEDTKTGLVLLPEANQFVLLEAKIFSGLSKRITNAKFYDQASRSIACMRQSIVESGNSLGSFNSLGFYVVAPESQIDRGIFDRYLDKQYLKDTVRRRVEQYQDDREHFRGLLNWYDSDFVPFMEKIIVDTISWEKIIQGIQDEQERIKVNQFYKKILEYNKRQ